MNTHINHRTTQRPTTGGNTRVPSIDSATSRAPQPDDAGPRRAARVAIAAAVVAVVGVGVGVVVQDADGGPSPAPERSSAQIVQDEIDAALAATTLTAPERSSAQIVQDEIDAALAATTLTATGAAELNRATVLANVNRPPDSGSDRADVNRAVALSEINR